MLASEFLDSAKALIEKGWCQQATARDCNDNRVDPYTPEAVEWDIVGALLLAGWRVPIGERPPVTILGRKFLRSAIGAHNDNGFAVYNDYRSRTKAQILGAFDEAIRLAKAYE